MLANVDWTAVKGSVVAIAIIILCMAPFFWWLYDSDRFSSRYWPLIRSGMLILISLENLIRHVTRREWWEVVLYAFCGVAAVIMVVCDYRGTRRKT